MTFPVSRENPFPYVRAARGGCTSGNQTLQLHGSSCRPDWDLRPVPAKGKYQGCVVEYRQEITGKRLNLIPP